ncbi:MAG TPA: protoheme IX farnesyltransferase [Acidimicrobiaceae bacterium]|nr:protoheme IX farnesyltransferase [Acidimicrobiaceae bacterium]
MRRPRVATDGAAAEAASAGDVAARPASAGAPARATGPAARVRAYVALTKPRIIELLLVTTIPPMIVADQGVPSAWLILLTVVGGTLAAAGANTFNMYVDRDIDALMARTAHRPLVTGAASPRGALVFGVVLEAAAFAVLWPAANLLAASLALAACVFYVFVYSVWLKRTSRQNIVIGGAAGATPVLVGWAAVTGSLGVAPWLGFALVFFWTPPHFWALAIRYADDYAAAGVPMLPVVATARATTRQIVLYTVAVVALSLWFGAVVDAGPLYWVVAASTGAVFAAQTLRLWRAPSAGMAMAVFHSSIAYLGVLFCAMAADVIVRVGW